MAVGALTGGIKLAGADLSAAGLVGTEWESLVAPGPTSGTPETVTSSKPKVTTSMPAQPATPRIAADARSWTWDQAEGRAREAADPGALYAAGQFHVFTTSTVHCTASDCHELWVPRFASDSPGVSGRLMGDAMPGRPAWVAPADRAIWAPAVAEIEGRYVLYFAATSGRPTETGMKCLGTAVAASPDGPFAPLPDPLQCTPGYWSIDPYPVVEPDGQWHLLWRQDDAFHITGKIVSAPLSADGLTLVPGAPTTTLLEGAFAWEAGYPDSGQGVGPIENPAMVQHPVTGDWLLTWSANRWETQAYATGLATCEGPAGPCRRVTTESPWLRTTPGPNVNTDEASGGMGGLSFTIGPERQVHAFVHAYAGAGRAPESPRVAWTYQLALDEDGSYRLTEVSSEPPEPDGAGVR